MLIDWFTVGAQAINFIILVWLLKRFLYKPILDAVDAREPTGILTHHLAFDAPAWSFLDALLARTRAHRAAQWLCAGPIFAAAAAVTCGRSA